MTAGFRGGRKKPGRPYVRTTRDELRILLQTMNLTVRRAAEIVQRDYETVRKTLLSMRAAGEVHICEWIVHPVGPHESVWALGNEPDEPNPKRLSDRERCRRYRARRSVPRASDPLSSALVRYAVRRPQS